MKLHLLKNKNLLFVKIIFFPIFIIANFIYFIFKKGILPLPEYIARSILYLKSNLAFYEFQIFEELFKKDGIKFNPDFIHANDLSTLQAGYKIKQSTNAKLIYDSHELEMDKNRKYPKYVNYRRKVVETEYIKKSDTVITVSESIAHYLKNSYKIKKPFVVYNSPKFEKEKTSISQFNLRKYLGIKKNSKIIIYVGLISFNRGIENTIESMKYFDEDTYLLLVGPVNPTFNKIFLMNHFSFTKENEDFTKHKYKHNLILHTPVNHNILNKIIKGCDVSILPIQNICKSYDYCFPNKLLESVFSGIPIAASALTELSKFVKKYKSGVIFNEKDPKDIYLKISKVLNNPSKYFVNKKDLKEINDIYSFEKQELILKKIYK